MNLKAPCSYLCFPEVILRFKDHLVTELEQLSLEFRSRQELGLSGVDRQKEVVKSILVQVGGAVLVARSDILVKATLFC